MAPGPSVRGRMSQSGVCAIAWLIGMVASSATAAGSPCAALSALTIPDVSIVFAISVPAGSLALSTGTQSFTVPALCRIVAVATTVRLPAGGSMVRPRQHTDAAANFACVNPAR